MQDVHLESTGHANPSQRRPSIGALLAPIVIVILALSVRLPLLDAPGFLHDQEQFIIWGFVAQEHGLAGAYAFMDTPSGPKRLSNYPPVQILICRALAAAYPTVAGGPLDGEVIESVTERAANAKARAAYTLFKWPAVVGDVACSLLLFFSIRRRESVAFALFVGAAFALLPNVWHNSAVWGAVDSLPVLFLLAAFECVGRKKAVWTGVFSALAILTKPQAVIFLPVIALIQLGNRSAGEKRGLATTVLSAGLTAIVLIVPFWRALGGVADAYIDAPGFYPLTHLNGFSAWFLGTPLLTSHLQDNLLKYYVRDDQGLVLGITARQVGLIAFLGIGAFVLSRLWKRRADDCALRWSLRIIPLAFFVCSTQMHERYLYPVVAIWAWTARPTMQWISGWGAICVIAAVNVLWVWVGPFSGEWVLNYSDLLHRRWLGMAPGAICSIVLIWLLAWMLVAEVRRSILPSSAEGPSK